MSTFKIFHRKSYSAIDPSAPANSQVGRTVLITGGGSGIGYEMAKSFLAASATRVIITGRGAGRLEAAVASLRSTKPIDSTSTVLYYQQDISDMSSIESLWASLKHDEIEVDALVLNAMVPGQFGVTVGWKKVWESFEANVLGNLRMCEGFLGQGPKKGKSIINISTASAHINPATHNEVYSSTKASFTHLFQNYAGEIPVDECQMISCHPGRIYTEGAKDAGYKPDAIPHWDNVDLPGSWSVWASTPQAAFLHGRFVWTSWDVKELEEKVEELSDPGFLQFGLQGIPPVSTAAFFAMA